ncbi:MAG: hypothetical protein A4E67_01597 [Syntrophaceae bacterium PtaB.Bin038]|nr:MAG: hypothetical protein A4E67_01597 [Syntrophaceae bacterium PtaB.Bin038]
MRSRSGPETLARYCLTCWALHRQLLRASARYPQGQGFMAATSMNRDGKVAVTTERVIVTCPSSRGCRRTSSTLRLNSGSSSRNSTPLCARLISPGFGVWPPPTSPASEIV